MLDRKEVIEKAMAFPMDKVIYRYQQEKKLSTGQARRHERELKRFLALVALNDKGYGLKGPIDDLWHTFILFTKLYAHFCREVAGRFIHHEPNVIGFEASEAHSADGAVQLGSDSYEMFLHDYQEMFNEAPSQQLWPQIVKNEVAPEVVETEECRGVAEDQNPPEECRGVVEDQNPPEECRGVPDDDNPEVGETEECRGVVDQDSATPHPVV